MDITWIPLLYSGFSGLTPLINMGVKCSGKFGPVTFLLLISAKLHTNKHQFIMQCYFVDIGMFPFRRDSQNPSLTFTFVDCNTGIPTHFMLLSISKSIQRLKLQWDFWYKFICLGCRTRNWFSYSFKIKLKVILYSFLKKLEEQLSESGIQHG